MDSFPDLDVYRGDVSLEDLGDRDFQGGYNAGYRVDGDLLEDLVYGKSTPDGEVVDDSSEYVLWSPLRTAVPDMETEEDVMSYHLARARNTEVMREEGLNVPDTGILSSDLGSFLVTPYVSARQSFAGDRQRNNPHRNGPVVDDDRQMFHNKIRAAKNDFPAEELVKNGDYIDAGKGFFDDHQDNWGLRGSDLVRFDLGEVPSASESWEIMPYDGPEEFYRDEGIRDAARELLEDLEIDPEREISEEYESLMNE
jgi:hypothetical protein